MARWHGRIVDRKPGAREAKKKALYEMHAPAEPELTPVRSQTTELQRHQIKQAAAISARQILERGAPDAAERVIEQIGRLAEFAELKRPDDPMFAGVGEEHRKVRLCTGWNRNALTASRVLHEYVADTLEHVMGRAVQSHRIESAEPQLSELSQAFLGFGAGFLTELRKMLVEEARQDREIEEVEAEAE